MRLKFLAAEQWSWSNLIFICSQDNHNPHLELTLSTRKKISSVLEHLNRKWGNASVASGELMLFPYGAQRENLVGYQRWTQDSVFSAADVYAMIGSPPMFRLRFLPHFSLTLLQCFPCDYLNWFVYYLWRYGWFSDTELGYVAPHAPSASGCVPSFHNINVENKKEQIVDSVPGRVPSTSDQSENFVDPYKKLTSVKENDTFATSSSSMPKETSSYISTSKCDIADTSDPAANVSWPRKETGNEIITGQAEDMVMN